MKKHLTYPDRMRMFRLLIMRFGLHNKDWFKDLDLDELKEFCEYISNSMGYEESVIGKEILWAASFKATLPRKDLIEYNGAKIAARDMGFITQEFFKDSIRESLIEED